MGCQVARFYPLGTPDITLHCSGCTYECDPCISATGIPPTSSAHWAWSISQPPPPRHASPAAQPTLTALGGRPHRPPPLRQRQSRTAGARPGPHPPSVAPPGGSAGAAPGARSRGPRAPAPLPPFPQAPSPPPVWPTPRTSTCDALLPPPPPPVPPSTGASGSHPAAPPAAPFLGACAAAAPRTHGGFPTTPTARVCWGWGRAWPRQCHRQPTPPPHPPRGGAPAVRAASRRRLAPPAHATRSCALCVAVSLPRGRRVPLRAPLPTPLPIRARHRVRRPATRTAGARTRSAAPAAGDRGCPGYLHPPRAVTPRFVGGGGGGRGVLGDERAFQPVFCRLFTFAPAYPEWSDPSGHRRLCAAVVASAAGEGGPSCCSPRARARTVGADARGRAPPSSACGRLLAPADGVLARTRRGRGAAPLTSYPTACALGRCARCRHS